jgi:hypothetical protein
MSDPFLVLVLFLQDKTMLHRTPLLTGLCGCFGLQGDLGSCAGSGVAMLAIGGLCGCFGVQVDLGSCAASSVATLAIGGLCVI